MAEIPWHRRPGGFLWCFFFRCEWNWNRQGVERQSILWLQGQRRDVENQTEIKKLSFFCISSWKNSWAFFLFEFFFLVFFFGEGLWNEYHLINNSVSMCFFGDTDNGRPFAEFNWEWPGPSGLTFCETRLVSMSVTETRRFCFNIVSVCQQTAELYLAYFWNAKPRSNILESGRYWNKHISDSSLSL